MCYFFSFVYPIIWLFGFIHYYVSKYCYFRINYAHYTQSAWHKPVKKASRSNPAGIYSNCCSLFTLELQEKTPLSVVFFPLFITQPVRIPDRLHILI